MKRFLTALLAVTMLFSLCACNKKEEEEPAASSSGVYYGDGDEIIDYEPVPPAGDFDEDDVNVITPDTEGSSYTFEEIQGSSPGAVSINEEIVRTEESYSRIGDLGTFESTEVMEPTVREYVNKMVSTWRFPVYVDWELAEIGWMAFIDSEDYYMSAFLQVDMDGYQMLNANFFSYDIFSEADKLSADIEMVAGLKVPAQDLLVLAQCCVDNDNGDGYATTVEDKDTWDNIVVQVMPEGWEVSITRQVALWG